MKHILSIQSHVAFGYVGNRAATFPLQRLGFDVSVINTVQFSNHTGYGQWKGEIFSDAHIRDVFAGIRDRGILLSYDALLTGYLGSSEIGAAIVDILNELKAARGDLLYCCDPVIGDTGRGIFVKPGVGEFIRDELITHADIATPNEFELNFLTGQPLGSLEALKSACDTLLLRGVKQVLVTSVTSPNIPDNKIGLFLHSAEGSFLALTPRLEFKIPPNGAGDATAALYLGHYLRTKSPQLALAKTAEAIFATFLATYRAKTRELQLISSQDCFENEEYPNCELTAI